MVGPLCESGRDEEKDIPCDYQQANKWYIITVSDNRGLRNKKQTQSINSEQQGQYVTHEGTVLSMARADSSSRFCLNTTTHSNQGFCPCRIP